MSARLVLALAWLALAAGAAWAASPLTLRWESIPGAASYEVEIARDRELTDVVHREKTTATRLRWTPPADGEWWWRVRALDVDGKPGEFSEAGVTGAPVALPSPTPVKTATPVVAATPKPTPAVASTPAPRPGIVALAGVRGGYFHNFAEVSSPMPAAELAARIGRVQGTLQIARYSSRLSAPSEGVRVRSTLLATPVVATAAYVHPFGTGTVHAGGGLSATWFDATVKAAGQPSIRSRSVAAGLVVLTGYARPIGWRGMEVSAEGSWCAGGKTDGAVEVSPSGASLTVGVRLPLGGAR